MAAAKDGGMTQQEATDQLNAANATLVKIGGETQSLLEKIQALEEALAAAGGPGGTITPELAQAVTDVVTQANAVDALVPDQPS